MIERRRSPEPAADPAAGGPPPDQAALFERHVVPELPLLYRAARRLTPSNAEAEDLVQDTLLRAFRSVHRFDGRHPRAWLLTIMRNANINRARKKRPDLLDDPDLTFERDQRFADGETPEATVLHDAFDAVVEDAFARLDEPFRAVVELVDLQGRSYAEAAEALDVPVGTVMSRLHRARRRIRAELTDAGVDGPHSLGRATAVERLGGE
ncbi:MAG: RNA polymerase sigma factor [Acidimicrobiales bacterium]